MITRSTPELSFCSRAAIVFPALIAYPETLSTIFQVIEDEVRLTSPACSTGLRRNCPLPCVTIDAQALKSMSRSLVSPAASTNWPPAICPDGILIPVCAWLDKRSGNGVLVVSLVSVTQFAMVPHELL